MVHEGFFIKEEMQVDCLLIIFTFTAICVTFYILHINVCLCYDKSKANNANHSAVEQGWIFISIW